MTEPEEKNADEIDIMEIVRKLWAGRKTILISTAIFFGIGILLALISPNEYMSQVSLLVEAGGSNPAATSGISERPSNLSGGPTRGYSEALTPALYPLAIGSTLFRREMIGQQVTDSKTGAKMTLAQYFEKYPPTTLSEILRKYTLGLPSTIIGAISAKKKTDTAGPANRYIPPVSRQSTAPAMPGFRLSDFGIAGDDSASVELTPYEKSKIKPLASRIKAEIKKGSGNLLVISVTMADPVVAKELAGFVVTTLTRYITDYRTRKNKNDYQFIDGLHAEAEKKYKRAQQILASYRDRNQFVIMSAARLEGESLQAEYSLALNVYTTLSQQLEQAKINVQENTPVFTLIEPPSDASKISGANKIFMIMIFLGILAGVGVVFGKPALAKFKKNLLEADKN